jgi:hypothetical protein
MPTCAKALIHETAAAATIDRVSVLRPDGRIGWSHRAVCRRCGKHVQGWKPQVAYRRWAVNARRRPLEIAVEMARARMKADGVQA